MRRVLRLAGEVERDEVDGRSGGRVSRLAAVEWAGLALLVGLFVAKGLIPAWSKIDTDFPNYYLSARLRHQGVSLDRLYEWVWFERQKDRAGIDWGAVGYGVLTPWSALVLLPLSDLPALTAKRCWLCASLLLLGATLALLRSMTRLPARRVALIAFAAIIPLRTNFLYGQQHVLVLFLLTCAAWLYSRGRDFGCGVAIAVAAALKVYPALFGVFFLLRFRWRALANLAATLVALVGIGVVVLGAEPFRVFFFSVLPRTLAGEGSNPYLLSFNTPTALLRRIFVGEPALNARPLVECPVAFAILQPLAQAAILSPTLWLVAGREHDPSRERLHWAAFLTSLLALSTAIATYHFCVLVLATVLAVDALLELGRPRSAAAIVALHLIICSPLVGRFPQDVSGWPILFGIPRGYATLAFWGVLVLAMGPTARARAHPWRAIVFGGAGLCAAALSAARTARHLASELAVGSERVPEAHANLIATAPTTAGGRILYSGLDLQGFSLDDTSRGAVLPAAEGRDWFHASVDVASGRGWVEESGTISRIIAFPLDPSSDSASAPTTLVEDAQEPVVSADGRWLGFLRERKGRGSLWVIDRSAADGGGGAERELVDMSRDVLEFAFLSGGRIAFSARDQGTPSLFTVEVRPAGLPTSFASERPARFPAASPNGRWLAYSVEVGGEWQLRVTDVQTREVRRLTDAECNATSPAWAADSQAVVYASDCGRGVEQTDLRRVVVPP
jgi:hypothetical protein